MGCGSLKRYCYQPAKGLFHIFRQDINSSAQFAHDIPVLLLVGGMGTRLRAVLPDKPKPLARIGDIPFLELLVLQLRSRGLRRIVMCTGFQANQIQQEFGDGRRWQMEIKYSEETCPLGTAGAIKLAGASLSESKEFIVMNGDSFLELNFRQFIQFHREHGGCASIAVRRVPNAARYGKVHLDESGRVIRFSEKQGIAEPGLVNGGVYMFHPTVLERIPDGPSSLEKDVLPALLAEGVFAAQQTGMFIDIGTPEDYARAQAMHQSLSRAAVLDRS